MRESVCLLLLERTGRQQNRRAEASKNKPPKPKAAPARRKREKRQEEKSRTRTNRERAIKAKPRETTRKQAHERKNQHTTPSLSLLISSSILFNLTILPSSSLLLCKPIHPYITPLLLVQTFYSFSRNKLVTLVHQHNSKPSKWTHLSLISTTPPITQTNTKQIATVHLSSNLIVYTHHPTTFSSSSFSSFSTTTPQHPLLLLLPRLRLSVLLTLPIPVVLQLLSPPLLLLSLLFPISSCFSKTISTSSSLSAAVHAAHTPRPHGTSTTETNSRPHSPNSQNASSSLPPSSAYSPHPPARN